ncbi:MAG: group 1 truncated hemoglobin [Polyangiales bacterium]
MKSHFDELGEAKLRQIVDDFIDRCYRDTMIGFLFARADKDRIKKFEYEHAAAHLGGPVVYGGRPLRNAHAPHRILGGQFDRRRQILIETLADHKTPAPIIEAWISQQDALRGEVTADPDSNCRD